MDLPTSDAAYVEMTALASSMEYFEAYLNNSHGEPTMSVEDTKLCIVALNQALKYQMLVNLNLISRIEELEEKPKKRFWKK